MRDELEMDPACEALAWADACRSSGDLLRAEAYDAEAERLIAEEGRA